MDLFSPDTPMTDRLVAFWRWLAGENCLIKDRSGFGRLVPLRPNYMQRRLHQSLSRQASLGKPIRIIDLKARKEGASTYFEALGYFLTKYTSHWSTRIVAHTADANTDLWEIIQRIRTNDPFGPYPGPYESHGYQFEHDSYFTTRTAGGEAISSGATTNFLHCSEVPKWPGNKRLIKAQFASLMGSVPEVPNSIIVLEATMDMEDTAGQFEAFWKTACEGSGFEAFFSPWIEEPSYRMKGATVECKDEYEKRIQVTHAVDDEQLAWRRHMIDTAYTRDVRYFRQEYPLTPEEAFQSPTGLIYPMLTVDRAQRALDVKDLQNTGYRLYRGFDWGDADAFVCLWVAHKKGPPGFSIDKAVCPNAWYELTHYSWDDNGRPRDKDDHACDALRYVITYFVLTGHVHIYREMYVKEAASQELSVLDLGKRAELLSASENISGSVGDRSRPGTILLLVQQGVHIDAFFPPNRNTDRSEKVDGIMCVQALINATLPLVYPPPEPPWQERVLDVQRKMPLRTGFSSAELIAALDHYETDRGEELGDPWFGNCN